MAGMTMELFYSGNNMLGYYNQYGLLAFNHSIYNDR